MAFWLITVMFIYSICLMLLTINYYVLFQMHWFDLIDCLNTLFILTVMGDMIHCPAGNKHLLTHNTHTYITRIEFNTNVNINIDREFWLWWRFGWLSCLWLFAHSFIHSTIHHHHIENVTRSEFWHVWVKGIDFI